jgi:hypothetical protein
LRGDLKLSVDVTPSASAADLAAKASEMAAKNATTKAAMVEAQIRTQQAANAAAQASKEQSTTQAQINEIAEVASDIAQESAVETRVIAAEAQTAIEPVVVAEVVAVGEVIAAEDADPIVALEETISESLQADPQHLALVNNITQGTWFEMQGDAGEKYRCRLAAIIRSVGKYIFVNRSGMKVAEESRESLAIALQTKRLTILDDGMLFDRALEAVIGTLREQRTMS